MAKETARQEADRLRAELDASEQRVGELEQRLRDAKASALVGREEAMRALAEAEAVYVAMLPLALQGDTLHQRAHREQVMEAVVLRGETPPELQGLTDMERLASGGALSMLFWLEPAARELHMRLPYYTAKNLLLVLSGLNHPALIAAAFAKERHGAGGKTRAEKVASEHAGVMAEIERIRAGSPKKFASLWAAAGELERRLLEKNEKGLLEPAAERLRKRLLGSVDRKLSRDTIMRRNRRDSKKKSSGQ